MNKLTKTMKIANIFFPLVVIIGIIYLFREFLALAPGSIPPAEALPTIILSIIIIYLGSSIMLKHVREITRRTHYHDLPETFYGKRKYEITCLVANICTVLSIYGLIAFHYLPLFVVMVTAFFISMYIMIHDEVLNERKMMMISKHFNPPI